ncbi:WD40 repeat-like protein [Rhizopogon vinicolor AM-OR11-026]|uniref:WD40 repeat-like protein n=1 Tax=Rhizopogon vinicolor AM-OR11-026 TaxID=1314800 RepID=A0A1B7MK49_9AGAM|nr:WD40 repeat-like protein [Rhizopogon vinicolor AM-OR11-026]
MASTSTRPAPAATEMILTPVITLKGHEDYISSISYFPDGKQMISACVDKAVRRWDLQAGKEIEKARRVCEYQVKAVAVSGDGQWVVTAGGDNDHGELKAWEVEAGIVKTFHGHSQEVTCIDISADSMLLASGSDDYTAQIWNLDTGKPVAGPFNTVDWMGAIRFSPDSKKFAMNSWGADWLEVWDIETQELDRRVEGKNERNMLTNAPVFWTNKGTRILAAFNLDDSFAKTLYEFDASTLEIVGAPFKGHTDIIEGHLMVLSSPALQQTTSSSGPSNPASCLPRSVFPLPLLSSHQTHN